MSEQILGEILSELRKLNSHLSVPAPHVGAVTVESAASILGCSRTTIFELLKRGELERCSSPGRKVMLKRESIENLLSTKEPGAILPPRRSYDKVEMDWDAAAERVKASRKKR